jgi:hypothetical protein
MKGYSRKRERESHRERKRGWVLKRLGEKEKSRDIYIYIYITKKNVKKYIFVKCKVITKNK